MYLNTLNSEDQNQDFEQQVSRRLKTKTQVLRSTTVHLNGLTHQQE